MDDISTMTQGVDSVGMIQYANDLRIEYLTNVCDKLDDAMEAIIASVRTGWKGESERSFELVLRRDVDNIKLDLLAEYADVASRLTDLNDFYFKEDQELVMSVND